MSQARWALARPRVTSPLHLYWNRRFLLLTFAATDGMVL